MSDLPAWGRVALSLAIPVLERQGIQTCCLPTALLSTHGGYPEAVVQPQTAFMEAGLAHLDRLGLGFSAVYAGFVAEAAQFPLIQRTLASQAAKGAIVLVDPILGDNGRLYGMFSPADVPRMRELVGQAHLITPNITEAALLLGHEPARRPADAAELRDWLSGLAALGPRFVALTSAPMFHRPAHIGVMLHDARQGSVACVSHARAEPSFPGTGDYFASLLLASLVRHSAARHGAAWHSVFHPRAGSPGPAAPGLQSHPVDSLDHRHFVQAARQATRQVRRALAWSRHRTADPRRGLLRI